MPGSKPGKVMHCVSGPPCSTVRGHFFVSRLDFVGVLGRSECLIVISKSMLVCLDTSGVWSHEHFSTQATG